MLTRGPTRSLTSVSVACAWMVGLQLLCMAVLLVVASWRLRPIFRHQEETPARTTWSRARKGRRRRAHPECGHDAILWKERYFAPSDIFTKLVLLPAIVAVTLPLILCTEIAGGFGDLLYDLWRHGLATSPDVRWQFGWALQVYLGWYTGFWLLAIAGASAASVAHEREADTWVSLTSSPLTGREILRAKALGAIWNQRGFAAVIVGLWLVGILSTALRVVDVLTSIAYVTLLTWLVTAIGIHGSLRAQTTSRAIVATITLLCVFNGYPLIIASVFIGKVYWESSFLMLGAMPWFAVSPFISPKPTQTIGWQARPLGDRFELPPSTSITAVALCLLVLFACTAAILTWRLISRFDIWLDRPRLTGETELSPAPSQAALAPQTEEAVVA
jgi:hypothetical protein